MLNKSVCQHCHKTCTETTRMNRSTFKYWNDRLWSKGTVRCPGSMRSDFPSGAGGPLQSVNIYGKVPRGCHFILEHTVSKDNE